MIIDPELRANEARDTENKRQESVKMVIEIKEMLNKPNKKVEILHWLDKSVEPATKVTVTTEVGYFILDEIPGNSSSMDIYVNNKFMWVTDNACFNELLKIRNKLVEQYDKQQR